MGEAPGKAILDKLRKQIGRSGTRKAFAGKDWILVEEDKLPAVLSFLPEWLAAKDGRGSESRSSVSRRLRALRRPCQIAPPCRRFNMGMLGASATQFHPLALLFSSLGSRCSSSRTCPGLAAATALAWFSTCLGRGRALALLHSTAPSVHLHPSCLSCTRDAADFEFSLSVHCRYHTQDGQIAVGAKEGKHYIFMCTCPMCQALEGKVKRLILRYNPPCSAALVSAAFVESFSSSSCMEGGAEPVVTNLVTNQSTLLF